MIQNFEFKNLFILDLANNHQGSVEHAVSIINAIGKVVVSHGVRAGIKFQFRELDTFIHPSHKKNSDNKHIPRFLSTRLIREQYEILLQTVRKANLLTVCTPFDETSVDVICNMGFDILKVGSCSAKDWPLLEKIADAGMPVIFSTGGLTLKNIDDVVSFFEHRGVNFSIMHCVSIYPTPLELCQLNQIDILRERYPNYVIGWSTHESPSATEPIQIAYAKGARVFERHVGLMTEKIKLNAYSSTPEQIDKWLDAYKKAVLLCGSSEPLPPHELEIVAMNSLKRGVYALKSIKKDTKITRDQVYFAMPYLEEQLESGLWQKEIIAKSDIKADQPLMRENLVIPCNSEHQLLKTAIHEVKAMLNSAKIVLNSEFEVEYSHHYGIHKFRETGAVIINCINREYCKKLVVQLPGQRHPIHYHQLKEETFQILYGILHVNLNGLEKTLHPGETCLIQPGVWHSFWTEIGCIFEEVSTTHYNNDSYYKEKIINKMARFERKTKVDHWGRFQLDKGSRFFPDKHEAISEENTST